MKIERVTPCTKFDALLEQSDAYDTLKEAFLVFGDANMTPRRLLNAITDKVLQGETVPPHTQSFVEALANWVNAPAVDEGPPPSFSKAAWTSYLKCIESCDYFFFHF